MNMDEALSIPRRKAPIWSPPSEGRGLGGWHNTCREAALSQGQRP